MSKEIKKLLREYKEINKGGQYSPRYACLMLDTKSKEMWIDEFYSVGHCSHIEYGKGVINLGKAIKESGKELNVENIENFINELK